MTGGVQGEMLMGVKSFIRRGPDETINTSIEFGGERLAAALIHKRDSVDSDRCYETTTCRLSDAGSNLARAWRESTTETFYGLSCGNLGTTKTPIHEKKNDTASMLNILIVDLIWRGGAGYGVLGY